MSTGKAGRSPAGMAGAPSRGSGEGPLIASGLLKSAADAAPGGRTATIRATRLPPSVASRGLAAGPWRAWGRPCGLGLGGAPAAVAVAAKGGVDDGIEELFEC